MLSKKTKKFWLAGFALFLVVVIGLGVFALFSNLSFGPTQASEPGIFEASLVQDTPQGKVTTQVFESGDVIQLKLDPIQHNSGLLEVYVEIVDQGGSGEVFQTIRVPFIGNNFKFVSLPRGLASGEYQVNIKIGEEVTQVVEFTIKD